MHKTLMNMAWKTFIFVMVCMTVISMLEAERRNDDSKGWLRRTKRCTPADEESGICSQEKETKMQTEPETTYFETDLPSSFSSSEDLTMVSSSSSDNVVSIPSCPSSDPNCDLPSNIHSTDPFMTYSKRNYDHSYFTPINFDIYRSRDDSDIIVWSQNEKYQLSAKDFLKIILTIHSLTPPPTITFTMTTTTTPTPTTTLTTTPEPVITTTPFPTTQEITTEDFISTTLSTTLPPTTTTTTSTTTTTTNEPIEAQLQRELQKGIGWYQSDMKWAVLVGGMTALFIIIFLFITILTIRAIIANQQSKRLNDYHLTTPHKQTVTYKEPYGYPSYV